MTWNKLVLWLLCVAGVAVAESPGPGRAGVLHPMVAMRTEGVAMQALSVRAVEVGGDVPAFGVLPGLRPVTGEVGEWRAMSGMARGVGLQNLPEFQRLGENVEALEVTGLPTVARWDVWVPWASMRAVRVSALELTAEGVGAGVRAVEPIRQARGAVVGWDLLPFPVARHSRMGDLRVAANAAEARGDAEEAVRLRREFLRIADVVEARREAFAGRPVPRRGGVGDER